MGTAARFCVTASGTPPLRYQWRHNGIMLTNGVRLNGVNSNRLQIGNVRSSDAGNYSANISNQCGALVSSTATLTVTPPERVVAVGCSTGEPLTTPIWLVAAGNENALGFSLNYDPALVRDPVVRLGSNALNASLLANKSEAAAGRLGIALALPSGSAFAAGTNEMVLVTFTAATTVTTNTTTPIRLGSDPVALATVDTNAHQLLTAYEDGCVVIALGDHYDYYEADVAPRPTGNNGAVTVADWVQVGRFVIVMDTAASGSEFQRADCAPRATLGDGALTIADWVQAGRYAGGLDAVALAGGPQAPLPPTSPAPAFGSLAAPADLGRARALRIANVSTSAGRMTRVPVILEAAGNENGLGFSLAFDPAELRFSGAVQSASQEPVTVMLNTNRLADGKVGLALALPAGTQFAEGSQELVGLRFLASSAAAGTSVPVIFTDDLLVREVTDTLAQPVTSRYIDGTVTVVAPPAPEFRLRLMQQLANGTIRLQISRLDGAPFAPSARDTIGVYTSTNLSRPLSDWTRLDNVLVLTNGLLQVDDLPTQPWPTRFYRAMEVK